MRFNRKSNILSQQIIKIARLLFLFSIWTLFGSQTTNTNVQKKSLKKAAKEINLKTSLRKTDNRSTEAVKLISDHVNNF